MTADRPSPDDGPALPASSRVALEAERRGGSGDSSWRSAVLLPVRAILYLLLVLVLVPLLVALAVLRAVYLRLARGRASVILRAHQEPYRNAIFLGGQMVFEKPFDNTALQEIFFGMVEEAGIRRRRARMDFEAEVPRPFPTSSGAMEADHYVERGTHWFRRSLTFKRSVVWLRVFNGADNAPTLLQCHLAGGSWDGSSCFNFMKELVNRYYGGRRDVFQGRRLTLKPGSAARLDQSSFAAFLRRLPRNVAVNVSCLLWQLVSAPRWAGGAGIGPELALINFDETDSARLAAGAKALGVSPFAVMTFAAVGAYRAVLGENPHAIVQQASLQTRHFEPEMERNLVGDWLIGPLQYVPAGPYTLEDAQRGYERLLDDLDNLGESVRRALEAKAYGVYRGGAAVFEVLPTYGDDSRVFDGIFFNNYGVRTVRHESGCRSWNWAAPFKLGFNTINVNGRTCICLASIVLGLERLRAFRDHVETTLRHIMEDAGSSSAAPPR
jgi:hypothetical protein